MRWAISRSILLAVGVLASGWRLKRALYTPGTAAVGVLSGLAGGAAALYGPPLILFWLGGSAGAAPVRDQLYPIIGLQAVVAGITLWVHDSAERRIGQKGVSSCRSRGRPFHYTTT